MIVCGSVTSLSPFALFQPTIIPTTTSVSAVGVTYGPAANATVSVSSSGGTVTGTVTLSVDGGSAIAMPLSNGSATLNVGVLNAGPPHVVSGLRVAREFLGFDGERHAICGTGAL